MFAPRNHPFSLLESLSKHRLTPANLRRTIQTIAIGTIAVGCAPANHTAARYRFDSEIANALEARAVQTCSIAMIAAETPKRPFITDGCTFIIDGFTTDTSWQECCVEHDIAYWCGGTSEMRSIADKELRACVAKKSSGFMGVIQWMGTRAGGHPLVPAHWRWGYGRDYPAGY